MPAMSWYEFKVSGLLSGTKADNTAEILAFLQIFPDKVPSAPAYDPGKTYASKDTWPSGLLLKDYRPAFWLARTEQMDTTYMGTIGGAPVVTQLTFHAQFVGTYEGSLYSNRVAMLEEVQWFYHYCAYPWLKDLKLQMRSLNSFLAQSGRVINAVDVRDWKWYCGNGAGD